MGNFSGSANFATTGGTAQYRLDVYVTTTEVSGGTQLYVTASATRIRFDTSAAFSSNGSRSYNVPGGRTNSTSGSLLESGSATWSYDFRNSNTQTVWGGFYRYVPYSYGTSTTVTITAAGSGSSFLLSTSVAVNVDLFQQVQTVTVPNLIGSNYVDAYNTITGLGLSSNLLGQDSTTNANLANTVSYQSPTGGTVVNVGSTVSWKYYTYTPPPTYTITYNGNNGTPSRSSDSNVTSVSLPSASRTHYTFDGWYTASSGGSFVGSTGSTYSPTSNITLYAQWTVVQYTISFEENGGQTVSNITDNYNLTVPLPTTTRNGFSFLGWFANSSLTDGPYTSWLISGNKTLYAKWETTTPTWNEESIDLSLLLNQDFSTKSNSSVDAENATSYEIVYAGSNLSPTSWLTINNSGQLSGSTNIVGVYSFVINAVNSQGDKTPSAIKTITVSYPGKRFNAALGTSNMTNARRYDGVNWIPIISMKRFDGTNWIDITN